MSAPCPDHPSRRSPGCEWCLEHQRGTRRRSKVCLGLPVAGTARTAADDAYVRRLLADLTDEGIRTEIRVANVADRCAVLEEHLRSSRWAG